MRTRVLTLAAGVIMIAATVTAARTQTPQDAPSYGPAKGTLVIVGGGSTEGTGIVEKFIGTAKGRSSTTRSRRSSRPGSGAA
jgi:hypothetical protein